MRLRAGFLAFGKSCKYLSVAKLTAEMPVAPLRDECIRVPALVLDGTLRSWRDEDAWALLVPRRCSPAGAGAAAAVARSAYGGSGMWRLEEAFEPLQSRLTVDSVWLASFGGASGAFISIAPGSSSSS